MMGTPATFTVLGVMFVIAYICTAVHFYVYWLDYEDTSHKHGIIRMERWVYLVITVAMIYAPFIAYDLWKGNF